MTAGDIAAELRGAIARTRAERPADRLAGALAKGAWIYGAGGYGRTVHRLMTARGWPVRGFIDRRAPDAALAASLGADLVSPTALPAIAGETVIVALHNFAADQAPVVAWARAAGFGEVLIPAELPELLGAQAGSYWLAGRDKAADHVDDIAALLGMLDDPLSVEVAAAAARFRMTGDIAAHPASDLSDQYFPKDLPFGTQDMRLVDGGAFTGDVLPAAARAGATIAEWYAFEPDLGNFAALAANAAASGIAKVALFPCGLGAATAQVRFAAGEAAGSHAAAEGDTIAQVVALDEVLHGVRPTHVKLDIEGYEREALAGMTRTLAEARPRLAMSIYHKPEDLWELPRLARELLPDATLHIRQHGYNGFDTVLYVIPR